MKIKKKKKDTKQCVVKRKLKFPDFKNCLEVAEIERKINSLEKNKFDVDSLKEDQKESVKNKLILKTQQRFKSDSIETYAYRTSKDLICNNEKIKRNNIIKQIKNA